MSQISLLTAQYFQQLDPHLLSLPSGPSLVSPATQTAIYDSMFSDTAWPLPPLPYQTRVLKMILSRIEESISDPDEDEIIEPLLMKWTSLLSTPKPSAIEQAQQVTYIKYTAPTPSSDSEPGNSTSTPNPEDEEKTIITSESRGLILSAGTTGFRTWEAALHLGTFLSSTAQRRSLVAGKRVLELGAGTGFLSFLCAKYLGPRSVLVTDREPALIDLVRDCIGKNGLEGGVLRAGIWEWGSELRSSLSSLLSSSSDGRGECEGGGGERVEFDIALGADLIYDTDIIPLLVSTIQDLFTNYALKEFIISATLRNEDTFRAFLETCETNRLVVQQIEFESPGAERQTGFFHSTAIPIRTYRILPARGG